MSGVADKDLFADLKAQAEKDVATVQETIEKLNRYKSASTFGNQFKFNGTMVEAARKSGGEENYHTVLREL